MSEQPEILEVRFAVVKRGGNWLMLDSQGNVVAGISHKAMTAIQMGKVASVKELTDYLLDPWRKWANREVDRVRGDAKRSEQAACGWGRKFQSMAQTARKRRKKGDKRGRKRSQGAGWDERIRSLTSKIKGEAAIRRRDRWHVWSTTVSRNLQQREANRQYKRQKDAATAEVARRTLCTDGQEADAGELPCGPRRPCE